MKFSILIAVEAYADSAIAPLPFAEADARALALAWELHGFDAAQRLLLTGGEATKTIVESRLRKLLRAVAADDSLYVFLAGRGCSVAGRNLLLCHDTQSSDLEATSLSLEWLLNLIRQSGCRHVAMFLDVGGCKLPDAAEIQGVELDWSDAELEAHFGGGSAGVCFAAKQPGEQSWRSGQLRRGIWANHVCEAFSGQAAAALEPGQRLTAASLVRHLQTSIPRTLRTTFADEKQQTPGAWGQAGSDFLLADLSELSSDQSADQEQAQQIARIVLLRKKPGGIRQLGGFHKGITLPDRVSEWAESLVASLAEGNLRTEIDAVHTGLKAAFKLKRADVQTGDPTGGAATIITPYFTYSITVSLDEEDPTQVVWQRQITDIKRPDKILSDEFGKLFGDMFDTLEFSPPQPIVVADLIDRVEQLEDDRLTLDYDRTATWCTLTLAGLPGKIHIAPRTFAVIHTSPRTPRMLLQSFFDIQRTLTQTHDIRTVPFGLAAQR